ncbi:MAG: LysR substrate-binding domain-containing protein [Anaeromyxobacter sp.]
MELDLLAVFEAVARTKSFSAAAKELGLPKSTVSRGVARLERDLEAQLLFRTTRQVSLTGAGTALYDRTTPLLRQLRDAVKEVPERREEAPSGVLRVTAPVDLGVLFLAEAITRYTARYPAVTVDLTLTGRVVDLVAERFDVALRAAPKLSDSTLVVKKVVPIVFAAYASPLYLARRGTPRTEEDLETHDWVVFKGGPQRLNVKALRDAGALAPAPSRARVLCDDVLFTRDAVRAGAGIGMLPGIVADGEVLAGRLVRVLPKLERLVGQLYLVTPATKFVPSKVSAFRDLVVEMLRTPGALAQPA